jgi:hypothetical protein
LHGSLRRDDRPSLTAAGEAVLSERHREIDVRMPDMTGLDVDVPEPEAARRTSAPWLTIPRLLAAGVALALVAVAWWVGLASSQVHDYSWPEDALVPVDGERHTVELSSDGSAMLWTYEADVTPTCAVVDDATGAELSLSSSDGTYRREGGSAGDWVGTAIFESPARSVEVTCTGLGKQSRSSVAVETAPNLPPFLAYFGPWVTVPVVLGIVGLLVVALAVPLTALRRLQRCGDR